MKTTTKSKSGSVLGERKVSAELRVILENWQNFYFNEAIFYMKSDTLSLFRRENE
ncbi:hypothetical protein [Cytobacillus firmus]|uniref:hypothetical protein n=1 Tax=Cytobacillus firmus TaxID=1399 RepID=UPI001C8DE9CF|nr:hypothetical protein [Cytobacillus firmus]MBX9975105.1 hypothetical protein [Cytobacillus firmus]